jgi:transcriptional regulator with XRE-family HTH domain
MLPASPLMLQRLIRGLNQTAVARALGVDQAKISKLERGRWLLGPTFRRLAAFYGLSPEPLRRRMVAWRRQVGRPIAAPPLAERLTGKRRAVA